MAEVVALLAELKSSMYTKDDGIKVNEKIYSQLNDVANTLGSVVERQAKAEDCIEQLSSKFQELATSMDDVKARLAAVEATTAADDDAMSDSSGLPSRAGKKARKESAGAGLGRSSPASWPHFAPPPSTAASSNSQQPAAPAA